ncbi:MAG: chromosome segregation protein SMC [Anaerolineaceae bacterium]|nr:chromosome segregation protein SMC [Anaerolineaceae bacterium]
MESKLKSLELHGYKTFANRTPFDYPVPITAIVGPNGSGKSNIADSIRWVLGEQSYSTLRGRKTEDMIFTGSEQRPRASMASATITFNNDDNWLPIDYAEVSVTRRAYRDGQNEYLLNGQKVRLRDISEMLAKSGLAERTYTMIGQGVVDAALGLKPEERRKFFEEAAGIGLYRSRRDESLNRLEATRRDLIRVEDILNELSPRLKSLERQAKKAEEYVHIKADLQVLLRDWYGFHWHKKQKQIQSVREVLKQQESQLDLEKSKQFSVEEAYNAQREKLKELRNQLNEWHAESASYHQEREKLSRNLAVLEERMRALVNQQQSLEADQVRVEEEQKITKEKINSADQDYEHLLQEYDEAKLQAENYRKQYDELIQKRDAAENEMRETRKLLVQKETQEVQLNARINEIQTRYEAYIKSNEQALATLSSEEKAVDDLEKNFQRVEKEISEKETVLAELQDEKNAHKQKVEDLEHGRKQAEKNLSQLEADLAKLSAQHEVLNQAEQSFSGLNQGAQFLLQSAKQGHVHGSLQALSHVMEVPEKVELAVAAVLGETVDGVLVEDSSKLEGILKLLASGQNGKAVLLLAANKHTGKKQLTKQPGVIGWLLDQIKVPDSFVQQVEQVLGDVILVEDHNIAREMVKNISSEQIVVTLRGEVFTPKGIVIAGKDGKAHAIGRTRKKKELLEKNKQMQKLIDSSKSILNQLHKDVESKNLNGIDIQNRYDSISGEFQKLRGTYQDVKIQLEKARQRLEWQQKQIQQNENQIKSAENNISSTKEELVIVQKEIEKYRLAVREKGQQLGAFSLDELQAQLNHWKTNAAVAEQVVREAKNRKTEVEQRYQDSIRRIGDYEARLQELKDMLEALQEEQQENRTQEKALNQSITQIRQKIDPAETLLQQIENENTAYQDKFTTVQQTVSMAERHFTQAQLEYSRQKDGLESLRRKIEDDFGLVNFEYQPDVSGPTPLPYEEIVEQLPVIVELSPDIDDSINRLRGMLRRLGAVNPEAMSEFNSISERFEFLTQQVDDLQKADSDLRQVVAELDELMIKEFKMTFDAVAIEFKQIFTKLFGGGSAKLVLLDENDTESGVDIEARLPGRREQGLSLLSGGERSLTAVALIFSLLKISPPPFCVLDEVDAALDEANVGRFCDLLKELSEKTQFIVITHNRNTVQTADVIYGVTMGRDSASQVISLKLEDITEDMVK